MRISQSVEYQLPSPRPPMLRLPTALTSSMLPDLTLSRSLPGSAIEMGWLAAATFASFFAVLLSLEVLGGGVAVGAAAGVVCAAGAGDCGRVEVGWGEPGCGVDSGTGLTGGAGTGAGEPGRLAGWGADWEVDGCCACSERTQAGSASRAQASVNGMERVNGMTERRSRGRTAVLRLPIVCADWRAGVDEISTGWKQRRSRVWRKCVGDEGE